MIIKLTDPEQAGDIFAHWDETIIWSCLQNIMGDIYAVYNGKSQETPGSAMAFLGDFCFLAGVPSRELVMFRPDGCGPYIIMVPQNDGWAQLIWDCHRDNAKRITRYAIKKEQDVFDKEKLHRAVSSLRPGFSLKMMDEELYHLCRSREWSRDLVSQYADYEMYRKLGIGVVALKNGQPVSGASSYATYRGGIEIEIDTKEEYRRKGLAYACGAKLILECLEQNLYPSWDAHNMWSVALAEKLGYHYDHEYTAFELYTDESAPIFTLDVLNSYK